MTTLSPGDTIDYVLPFGGRRVRGTVTAVAADGEVTAEFAQLNSPPVTVTTKDVVQFIPVATISKEQGR